MYKKIEDISSEENANNDGQELKVLVDYSPKNQADGSEYISKEKIVLERKVSNDVKDIDFNLQSFKGYIGTFFKRGTP